MTHKKSKRSNVKKPNVCPVNVHELNSAKETYNALQTVLKEKEKALDLSIEEKKIFSAPCWRDVAILLQSQADLLIKLNELFRWFEDPAVAHVIEMKKSIDGMKRQLGDLRFELESHMNNPGHARTDPYY